MNSQANFFKQVRVTDPITKLPVDINLYKHENGGIFGIDASYDEQVVDEEEAVIQDPLNDEGHVELIDEPFLND